MPVLVTLLRGVKVGGARPLKMATLKAIYEKLGFREVRTYLQSGNAVCRVPAGRLSLKVTLLAALFVAPPIKT